MALQKAKLIQKKVLTSDTIDLEFESEKPLEYKAGQYISIKINDEIGTPSMRAYSIACGPDNNKKIFCLCIKVIPDGRGTKWLDSLKINDKIEFLGPMGNFIFRKNEDKNACFIATGTGIAPLKAMIEEQLINNTFKKEMTLLFGVRYEADIFYKEYFEKIAEKHPNFRFVLSLSRPNENWKGNKGRLTEILQNMEINTEKTNFYICGLKDMIASMTEILIKKGVPEENLHYEKYD